MLWPTLDNAAILPFAKTYYGKSSVTGKREYALVWSHVIVQVSERKDEDHQKTKQRPTKSSSSRCLDLKEGRGFFSFFPVIKLHYFTFA